MGDKVKFTFSNEEDKDKFVAHQREYGNPTLNANANIDTTYNFIPGTYTVEINRDGINDASRLRGDADLMAGKTEFDD